MAKRQPTPLEALNRDHNWKMGSLRRTQAILQSFEVVSASNAALNALEVERQHHVDVFERRKRELAEHGYVLS